MEGIGPGYIAFPIMVLTACQVANVFVINGIYRDLARLGNEVGGLRAQPPSPTANFPPGMVVFVLDEATPDEQVKRFQLEFSDRFPGFRAVILPPGWRFVGAGGQPPVEEAAE